MLPMMALCISGALAIICIPMAVVELRYEAHGRAIRRIPPIPRLQVSGNQPVIRSLSINKITDKRRRTYSINRYLGPVPIQMDALPAPDEVPEEQKI